MAARVRATLRASLAVLGALAHGCGPPAAPADVDARPVETVEIGATHGKIVVPFDIAIHGSSAHIQVSLDGDVGTIEVGGRPATPALAYGFSQFPGIDIYQVLAVDPDRWTVVFFYCQGPSLTYLYYEDTRGGVLYAETARGSCASSGPYAGPSVDFPAFALALDGAQPHFAIDGALISRARGAPGTMQLGGHAITFFPITVVDCTITCGGEGWWEIHMVLWDEAAAKACFGILYLFVTPGPLLLTYTLTLPDLSDPSGGQTLFDATWTR